MSTWGTRRQLSFVLVFILFIIFFLVIVLVSNRRVPTCTDGIANQSELGVDCGGPCLRVCKVEAGDISVLWSRVFKVKDGKYDVAAYIENPNPFGLRKLDYLVKIYDIDNIPVKDIAGSTYVNPYERSLLFIPLVDLGFRIPNRAFVSFPNQLTWERPKADLAKPVINIRDQKIEESNGMLTVSAEVSNDSQFPVDEIELYAFLYDGDGNASHVSKSNLPTLPSGSLSSIVFTWPGVASSSVKSADIFARVNLVE